MINTSSTPNINEYNEPKVFTYPNPDIITTVKRNQEHFTRREIEGEIGARQLQQLIGWPSTTSFFEIINNNLITNCSITSDDIHRSQ